MLGNQRISEQRSIWDKLDRTALMFDTYRNSTVVPAETSMASMNELLPVSARASHVHPQYKNDGNQLQPYQSARHQDWSSNSFPSNQRVSYPEKKTSLPTKKFIIIASVIGIIIGLCICGIPLGVVVALFLQNKSSSSGTANTASAVAQLSQCSTYTTISDATRLPSCTGSNYYDCSWTSGWYRVTGGSGTKLATMAISASYCCTPYPGWFNGTLPSTPGSTTLGSYCVNYMGNLCYAPWSVSSILVTNCDSFYVYYLTSLTSCNTRYCTSL